MLEEGCVCECVYVCTYVMVQEGARVEGGEVCVCAGAGGSTSTEAERVCMPWCRRERVLMDTDGCVCW